MVLDNGAVGESRRIEARWAFGMSIVQRDLYGMLDRLVAVLVDTSSTRIWKMKSMYGLNGRKENRQRGKYLKPGTVS